MGKQEGIDHLIKAAHILVYEKARQDIQFILIGGGTQLGLMKELSRKLGMSDFITFTGRIPDEPMVEALCTADLCVNPDVATEMNNKSTMNTILDLNGLGETYSTV